MKEEKGFFDSLVDDFCRDLELKAAIEASRDENGKVDKWAALGGAMGLGHTSDDDIVMLGAMLGAEGAFEDDTDDIDDDLDLDYDLDDLNYNVTPIISSSKQDAAHYMSESEYDEKKKKIISDAKTAICIIVIAAVGILLGMLSGVAAESGITSVVCICSLAVLGWGLYYFSNQKEKNLQQLDNEYAESKKKQQQEDIDKQKREAAAKEFAALKNHAGTTDFCSAINSVYKKAKILFDEADKVCDIKQPTYDRGLINTLITAILYFSVSDCNATATKKSALFDLLCCRCVINTDFTGDMLFLEQHNEIRESMQNVMNEIYTTLTVASSKSGLVDGTVDFTKTLCSMLIWLGDGFNEPSISSQFAENAVHIVLDAAQKAAQRVIDERLLDKQETEEEFSDNTNDSNINMDSIMNKVENLVSDNEFLSRKLTGKEFEIICDSCKESVRITVSSELTGKCPVCGHENELHFSIK